MAVKVTIREQGEKYKNWGYEVESPLEASRQYATRARMLDGHFLLEERTGRSSGWNPFGIADVNMHRGADTRMLEKVRESAKTCLESLTPELVEDFKDENTYTPTLPPTPTRYSQLDEAKRQQYDAMPVAELELSVRAANCLYGAKIETIGKLVQKTDKELLGIRMFGKTSLREVKRRLQDLGLDTCMG